MYNTIIWEKVYTFIAFTIIIYLYDRLYVTHI